MRFGLLALSMVLLGGGGFAAQSALAITHGASISVAVDASGKRAVGGAYGTMPFAGGPEAPLRLALR
jgi:hypothetical protein